MNNDSIDSGPCTGLAHFLKLFRRGEPGTGASSGECRARQLAEAILAHAPGLDARAIQGACAFLLRAPIAPMAARDLLEMGGAE